MLTVFSHVTIIKYYYYYYCNYSYYYSEADAKIWKILGKKGDSPGAVAEVRALSDQTPQGVLRI